MAETTATTAAQPRAKVFYGWWIVLAGIVMAMTYGGLYAYGFSAYFRALTQEFGWSRTALSSVISLSRLEGGLIGPVVGFVIDRFGPRTTMLAGMFTMAAGYILLSQAQDFVGFAVVYVLILSAGSSLGTSAPVQAALANWFVRRRSFALGLLFAGFGLGGLVVPFTAWMVENWGWRTTAQVSAIILLTIGIPAALVMRQRPEQYGQRPDGDPPRPKATASGSAHSDAHYDAVEVDFTPREALRTRSFWLMALAWMLWSMLPAITTVHLIPYFTDLGFGAQTAASMVGLYAFIGGVCRPVFGFMGDRVNKRHLVAGLWVIQVVGLLLLARVQTGWDVALFMLFFAPAYGGLVPLRGALQADYFGRRNFATISGLIRVVDLLGTVAGPVAVGWAFDTLGGVPGYRLAFAVIAALNLFGALAIFLAKPPVLKRAPLPATAE